MRWLHEVKNINYLTEKKIDCTCTQQNCTTGPSELATCMNYTKHWTSVKCSVVACLSYMHTNFQFLYPLRSQSTQNYNLYTNFLQIFHMNCNYMNPKS